jgi:hypothetical protein
MRGECGGEGSKGDGVEWVMSYNRDWSIKDLESMTRALTHLLLLMFPYPHTPLPVLELPLSSCSTASSTPLCVS